MNLDQYKDKTTEYFSTLTLETSQASSALDALRQRLSSSVQSLIISNINKNKKNQNYYIFKLDANTLEILDVNQEQREHYLMHFEQKTAFHNDQRIEKDDINLNQLFLRMMTDLKEDKAKIYEERV